MRLLVRVSEGHETPSDGFPKGDISGRGGGFNHHGTGVRHNAAFAGAGAAMAGAACALASFEVRIFDLRKGKADTFLSGARPTTEGHRACVPSVFPEAPGEATPIMPARELTGYD